MSGSSSKSKTTIIVTIISGMFVCAAAIIGLGLPLVSRLVDIYLPIATPTTQPVVLATQTIVESPTQTKTPFITTTPTPETNAPNEIITFLAELSPRVSEAAGGNYCIGRDPVGDPPSCIGAKIAVYGTPYPHSLFAHADSTLVFDLNGQYETFITFIVLQGGDCGDGASFRIELDGQEVYKSHIVQHGEVPHDLRIDVRDGHILRLETYTGENNDYFCDGTIWGEPYLISKP